MVEEVKTAPAPDGAHPSVERARLGQPSYVWRFGLERRLSLIRRYVPLEGRRMLDIGCGVGAFVRRLGELSPHVYGVDIDSERVRRGAQALAAAESGGLAVAVSENLPFQDGAFDLVLLHEVLEHVRDDALTLREACRVTRTGGNVVIFCPNRLFPFETQACSWASATSLARSAGELPAGPLAAAAGAPRPGLYARRAAPSPGRSPGPACTAHLGLARLRNWRPAVVWPRLCCEALYPLESTPLRIFGLSHFVVLEKKV